MTRRQLVILSVLALSVLASAIAVVQTKFESRKLYHSLRELTAEQHDMNREWANLQIEQLTQANHERIERIAKEKLQMRHPGQAEHIITRKPQ